MTAQCLVDVAGQLDRAEISAGALVEVALRADDHNATERVLATAAGEARAADARRAAGARRGPFDGIPFAVKANIDVAGVPTSSGTTVSLLPAAADAAAVARFRAAGLIPARTATLSELAIGSVTDNPHTGFCRNPANAALSAGGSSGGSAALVAAGVVPLALGSDTMGSVRIPAAYCGIAGWKPSRAAVDTTGLAPLHPLLDTVGVLAATAADLAAAAELLLDRPITGLPAQCRIGVPDLADLADAAGRAALAATTDALAGMGLSHVPADLALDVARLRHRGLLICEAHAYRQWSAAVEADDPGLSDRVRGLLRYGRDAGAEREAAALATLQQAAATVVRVFDHVDVVILPVTPGGPPPLGCEPAHAADLTAWVNIAGLPAVAIPSGPATNEGMPRGVQLVAAPGADMQVLALAAALQAAGVGGANAVTR